MNCDEIFDFMSKFNILFYDDFFNRLLKIKNKTKSMKNYLNRVYGSRCKQESDENLYKEASILMTKYPNNYYFT